MIVESAQQRDDACLQEANPQHLLQPQRLAPRAQHLGCGVQATHRVAPPRRRPHAVLLVPAELCRIRRIAHRSALEFSRRGVAPAPAHRLLNGRRDRTHDERLIVWRRRGGRLMRTRIARLGIATAALVAVAVLMAGYAPSAAARPAPDACRRSAKAAFGSCKSEAHTDELLAQGICANKPDPAKQKTCLADAAAAAKDFRQSCRDQNDLRKMVCDRLGPTPYSPVIDNAHFPNPTTINNAFFPL